MAGAAGSPPEHETGGSWEAIQGGTGFDVNVNISVRPISG
jgi:hypothetical protein